MDRVKGGGSPSTATKAEGKQYKAVCHGGRGRPQQRGRRLREQGRQRQADLAECAGSLDARASVVLPHRAQELPPHHIQLGRGDRE